MSVYHVGKIVNTQGLKGEVRVISVTDFAAERYKKGQLLSIVNQNEKIGDVVVKSHRKHKNFDLLTFENHQSINDVEQYKGMHLVVDESFLHELEDDEFYYHEIIGLDVFCRDEKIGNIKEILELGSNDVWVVQRKQKKDALIPYINDVVLSVDVANHRVEIAEIEGLLD
ncbi:MULTISPECIES: ribosome maturation factor RimM [unclassified Granulicatella]|uniref:ribosome maturation factor RimM n=1 Tax=unclassified Granulicatella TaxID=2630493 RepID=UPI00107338E7|nr:MULTISPECIES: ribosome maturation factor RimM [unclassified Granulicatella]MBF0780299.1 ribosome maturation factor RimM [Granulicatella sp. 19428wC4_WM01]TFU95577.1 ribosome maturation factor RimM [Granulicatella sp. WM01]